MSKFAASVACVTLLLLTPAAAQQGEAGPGLRKTQGPNEWIAGRLAGSPVVTAEGEEVGVVNDIVIDKGGSVTALMVGMGGFLGIGQRIVAVPYRAISVGPIVNNRREVRVDLSRVALQRLPSFEATDPTFTDRLSERASEWGDRAVEIGRNASERMSEILREQQDASRREEVRQRREENRERRDGAERRDEALPERRGDIIRERREARADSDSVRGDATAARRETGVD